MGGSSGGSSTTTQNPWPGAQAAMWEGVNQLQPAYNKGAKVPVPMRNYGLSDQAAPMLASTIRGEYLQNNPYIDEVTRRAMADVDSRFSAAGRYGSGAHQDALMSAVSALRYQNYSQERQNQLQVAGYAPGYDMAPYEAYSAAVNAPYENASRYAELVNLYGKAGWQLSQPIYRNRTAGALGGAAAGGALGGAVAGASGGAIGGPVGVAGGAIIGGLLGAYG